MKLSFNQIRQMSLVFLDNFVGDVLFWGEKLSENYETRRRVGLKLREQLLNCKR